MKNNIVVFWNVIMCHLVDTNILEETAASTCRREVWAKLQETLYNIQYDWDYGYTSLRSSGPEKSLRSMGKINIRETKVGTFLYQVQ